MKEAAGFCPFNGAGFIAEAFHRNIERCMNRRIIPYKCVIMRICMRDNFLAARINV